MRETIYVARSEYLYRCAHLTMEGDCEFDHGPRPVTVGPFEVDRFPVTNERFYQFMQESGFVPSAGHGFLRHWQHGAPFAADERLPVVWISVEEAEAFASWAGGRLLTDEEWQYVAAGPDYRRWPWGDSFDATLCNHDGARPTPVDSHISGASWCGVEDLSGNVWEWTQPTHDDGYHRFVLLRGGAYFHASSHWHVAAGARPTDYHWKLQLLNREMNRAGTVGFRCVYEGDA